MRASFIIVNYNRKDEILLTIAKTKETIKSTAGDFEIIIVDNASTDGSSSSIKAQFPDIILIENPTNTGAPAWNLGFEKARGDYFVILDDDSHIQHGLTDALSYLDQHTEIGVLALNIKGGVFDTKKWINLEEKIGFIGCGAIIKKELYKAIGGYADWIFLYTNEWDYGIRTINAGYKVVYFENCIVNHRVSNINRSNQRLITYSARNEMGIIYKYFSKESRDFYIRRTLMNHLKGIRKYGIGSLIWYYNAWKEFKKLTLNMEHTPVKKSVQDLYAQKFWSTNSIFHSH